MIDTDSKKIEQILSRGVETIYPKSDFVRSRLQSGEQLTIYLGIDPTGPTLHLGHVVALRKLAQFQQLGHKIILLIGDFTARIGDPDKKDVRKQLSREQVLDNAKQYKQQASLFLGFDGDNPAEFKFNHDWLSKMNFSDVLELASKMTVQQMLERDMFKRRIKEQRPIYIHEFMYPLMQGYDCVVMDVDGEVGGNDQTFNMLAGRTLMKEMTGKEKFVIPMKLLVDTTGAKMGKTTGNMLSFLDSADEKFGKVMSWTDGMLMLGFELCTDHNLLDIQARLEGGENPRDLKLELARTIVTIFDGADAAAKAQDNFITQFQKKDIPDDLPEVDVDPDTELLPVLKTAGLVTSGNQARQKVTEGALQLDGKKVVELKLRLTKPGTYILKLGRKMVKIKVAKK